MNINTFSIFLTVVEEMNFTRAAQRLFMTQQSLSGHIRRLEEEYGVILFERKPALRLTAEGESMAFYARQILQVQNSMCNEFADMSVEYSANLDIGMSFMRSSLIGRRIWKQFHRRYPNIRVRITEKTTTALIGDLQQGKISIMTGVDIRPVPGLLVRPVIREHLCCVISKELYSRTCVQDAPADPAAGELLSVRQLREIPMMFPTRGNRLRSSLDRMYRSVGFMPKIIMESERQDMLYRLAKAGEGAAIVSPMVLCDENLALVMPRDCCVLRIRETQPTVLGIARLEDVQLTHYEEMMAQTIREEFLRYGESIARIGLRG